MKITNNITRITASVLATTSLAAVFIAASLSVPAFATAPIAVNEDEAAARISASCIDVTTGAQPTMIYEIDASSTTIAQPAQV